MAARQLENEIYCRCNQDKKESKMKNFFWGFFLFNLILTAQYVEPNQPQQLKSDEISESSRSQSDQKARIINFKEIAEARGIGQETLSPGGNYAMYVVTIPDVITNARREELYLASTDGRSIRRIETPPQSSPESLQWLPDGRRFFFLLRIEGKAQVYSGETEAAVIKPITRLAGSVDQYVLCPDGRMAFIGSGSSGKSIWIQDLTGETEPVPLAESLPDPVSLRWHPDGRRIFFLQAETSRAAAAAITPPTVRWQDEPRPPRHIRSLDIEAKREQSWTTGPDFSVLNFEIAADGKSLAFQTQSTERPVIPDDPEKMTLRLLDLENADTRVLVPKMGGPGQCSYAFSPDGRKLAFKTPDRLEYQRYGKFHILDLANGRMQNPLEKEDIHPRSFYWNETSDGLFFYAVVGINRPWFSLMLADGNLSRLAFEPGTFSGRYAPAAKAFIFMHSDSSHPYEVFFGTAMMLADRSRWVPLSRANSHLLAFPLNPGETVRWKSKDGREIEGILYKPLGFKSGRRYPMIVQANGGANFFGSNYQSYTPFLAARGYLVFQPNYRGLGSDGYGEEYRFEGFFPHEVLDLRTQDILSGVEHLIHEGIADPDRLALMGWSVGGGTVDWLMTQTPLFKAISSGAGGGDMISTYGQIEQYRFYFRKTWGSSAFRSWDYYADRSALKYISRAKTPTLINVGENDEGVTAQCLETYNALREFGVPVEMLVHAGQPHILQSPQSILAKMLAEFCWFEQWINGGPSWLRWRDEFAAIVNGH
jgi:dipeptidyl aminopeptidase/acylaminoacyl peptidase